MHRTRRWFLGLESSVIKALHIVDDQGQRERSFDYISGEAAHWLLQPYSSIVAVLSKTQHLPYNTEKWVGIEVSMTVNITFVQGLG